MVIIAKNIPPFHRASGVNDMEELVYVREGGRFVMLFARMHVEDRSHTATVVTADVTISQVGKLDDMASNLVYSHDLAIVRGIGLNFDMNLRIHEDELHTWMIEKGSAIQFQWTNPDAGKLQWGLEVGVMRTDG